MTPDIKIAEVQQVISGKLHMTLVLTWFNSACEGTTTCQSAYDHLPLGMFATGG